MGIGETGDGRYKIYILHHITLMNKLLHSILGVPLAHYVYYNLKGVLHPRSVFGLFLHFSQKLQDIGNK